MRSTSVLFLRGAMHDVVRASHKQRQNQGYRAPQAAAADEHGGSGGGPAGTPSPAPQRSPGADGSYEAVIPIQ